MKPFHSKKKKKSFCNSKIILKYINNSTYKKLEECTLNRKKTKDENLKIETILINVLY